MRIASALIVLAFLPCAACVSSPEGTTSFSLEKGLSLLVDVGSGVHDPRTKALLVAVIVSVENPHIRDLIGVYAWQRTHRGPPRRYRCDDALLYYAPSEGALFGCDGRDGVFTCRPGDCLLEQQDPEELSSFGEAVEVKPDRKRRILRDLRYRWRKNGGVS